MIRSEMEKKKSKYSSLRKMITNMAFVKNLNAMSDALDELGDLSTVLQRRNITILEADKAIRTTIRVTDSRATEPGPKLSSAIIAIHKKSMREFQFTMAMLQPLILRNCATVQKFGE